MRQISTMETEVHEKQREKRMWWFLAIGILVLIGPVLGLDHINDAPPYEGYRANGYPAISTPSKNLVMSFTSRGVVASIQVQESDVVKPGQVVAALEDEAARLSVKIQQMTAEDDSDVRAAQARLDMAEFDLRNVLDAQKENAMNPNEVEHARITRMLREIELKAAERTMERNQVVYERDRVLLDDLTLRSNIEGIVIRIEAHEGEAINELEPVVRLAAIDPLWMDVAVPIRLGMVLRKGSSAIVSWRDLPEDTPLSDGRVLWVSPIADASSNQIIVRLEINNPERKPAGLHAFARFPEADEQIRHRNGEESGTD